MLKTAFEKLFKIRENASRARARSRAGADEGFDAHEKPFLDHLEDLRSTLIKIGITLSVSTFACFAFHIQIFELIQVPAKMPLAQISDGVSLWDRLDLITLSPPEFIVLMLKLSFFSGVIITFPFTVYFLFQFILPGLRQIEKKAIIPGAAVGFILFLTGVAFAFFLAAPVALKFFYVFENERISNIDPTKQAMEKSITEMTLIGIDGEVMAPVKEGDELKKKEESSLTPEMRAEILTMLRTSFATVQASNIALRYDEGREMLVVVETKGGRSIYRIGEYINFITRLMLVFGISFQLPVIVTILVKLELLTARVMRSTRTYAWIIILVAAAILTPPDVMTLGLLGGPMIFLYEICILIASFIERSREKRMLAEEESRRSRLEKLYMKPSEDLTESEKEEIHKAEIEQYEKEHAHLYESESDHGEEGGDDKVARDGLHGGVDPYHDHQHDESWHGDDHYWHDGHEDDPHHGMESDHAEPEDLKPIPETGEGKPEEEMPKEDIFHDDDACAPSGPIVDLNHATMEELLSLPGVGPKMAQAIVDHRPYETFDDVEIVPGLGPKKLNAMIDRLMLG